jgi:gluconolactonase
MPEFPRKIEFEILDPRFASCIDPSTELKRLWAGGLWTEGPAWLERSGELIWSDIPNNRMLAWAASDGSVRIFRHPSNGGNGNTVDREGRLVTCEQYTRRISRTERDGSVTILADNYAGKRFTAPNDVIVKSDGTIWFTDPDYGKATEYEGETELDGCHVYKLDPESGEVTQQTNDFVMPNGLAFTPDESFLYVIDTGSTHQNDGPNHIRCLALDAENSLRDRGVFAVNDARCFDGLRVDKDGRLWCGAEDGVHCYSDDGTLIGKIKIPERASNLCFGGKERNLLMITATTSLYLCAVNVTGA